MNTPPDPALLTAGLSGVIEYTLLLQVANATSRPAPKVLEDLACFVAQQYAKGEMTYEDADAIMNSAFCLATSQKYLAEHDCTVPPFTFEVYQAFDEGEYRHCGDRDDIDAEEKYTRPLIAQFLAARSAGS